MSLSLRRLGRTDVSIPPLILGTNVFGSTVDAKTSADILDACFEAGLTALDTADVYNVFRPGGVGGESENAIGAWMKARKNRTSIFVATKVGMRMGEGRQGLSRRHILRTADEALTRLQTDYIDLFQAHADDETVPLEETLAAFGELIQAGKVRMIGASQYSADRLAQALTLSAQNAALPRFEVLQPLYNLCERTRFEQEYAPFAQENGLGVITYFALASGFLTGKYRTKADLSQSWRGARVEAYLTPVGMRILSALDDVAADLGASPAQVALAWQMHKPAVTAPITGASKPSHVGDLIKATQLALPAEHVAALDQASEIS